MPAMLFGKLIEKHRALGRSYNSEATRLPFNIGAGHARDAFPQADRKASRPRALLQ